MVEKVHRRRKGKMWLYVLIGTAVGGLSDTTLFIEGLRKGESLGNLLGFFVGGMILGAAIGWTSRRTTVCVGAESAPTRASAATPRKTRVMGGYSRVEGVTRDRLTALWGPSPPR